MVGWDEMCAWGVGRWYWETRRSLSQVWGAWWYWAAYCTKLPSRQSISSDVSLAGSPGLSREPPFSDYHSLLYSWVWASWGVDMRGRGGVYVIIFFHFIFIIYHLKFRSPLFCWCKEAHMCPEDTSTIKTIVKKEKESPFHNGLIG